MPPRASAANIKLNKIINHRIPSLIPDDIVLRFLPHIRLLTGITPALPEPNSPQKWLESFDLTAFEGDEIKVVFTGIKSGTTFLKKCYFQVERTSALVGLQKQLQAHVFRIADDEFMEEAIEEWDPSLNILYCNQNLLERQLPEISSIVEEEGVQVGTGRAAWRGGRIQLVDTSLPVVDWQVLAERRAS